MDVTFSLLPLQLVPFRRMSLRFMFLAVFQKVQDSLSYFDAVGVIEAELVNMVPEVSFVHVCALVDWIAIIMEALHQIRLSGHLYIEGLESYETGSNAELHAFICKAIEYESTDLDPPIRGPDALAWDYHEDQGGPLKQALFLFGTASQHRRCFR